MWLVKQTQMMVVGLMLVFSGGVMAADFVEGTHYERLPVAVDTQDKNSVEVVEVFSYLCVHCYNFDPMLESWRSRQASDVNFLRVPAVFNNDWELLAQAFYTADSLDVLEQTHMPMFEGLHVNQEDLRRPDNLADLYAENAQITQDDFNFAYNSFSVRSRVQQAKAKSRAYRVTGVPSMIVNGKYRIDGPMAGSNAKMLEVVDYLVNLERAALETSD
ncbi:MAG: thiol:disulfide interchange protein DsbA/DsbL [Gammaproteobacteria bacterium]|jgi:protein dithiol oxidoreductase (disulfide-forming)|nr:thiol:disulfide interchange protein DsbA/DsbL [Gammaproteobacteria bacterium]MCH1549976.1 thiol:disulfide interchange protein DsbA/DsbL [Pseudomonadales bacterium]